MADALDLGALDLAYLGQFVGQRVNELVMQKLAEEGYGDLRVSHGYVIQHLIEQPRSISELAARLGVTQQAASKTVAELVALGYLTAIPARDRRARAISLTERARTSLAVARKFRSRLERRLAGRHGAELARARELLATVLEELGGADAVRARSVREPR